MLCYIKLFISGEKMFDGIYKTMKGYEAEAESKMTSAMEDYLEMILRLSGGEEKFVRIGGLAAHLGVRPSSASKMMSHLKDLEYVNYEKYGYITLTERGKEYAEYLIKRHNILNRLFCKINGTESELKQVEQTEHFFDRRTVNNISKFLDEIDCNEKTERKNDS